MFAEIDTREENEEDGEGWEDFILELELEENEEDFFSIELFND